MVYTFLAQEGGNVIAVGDIDCATLAQKVSETYPELPNSTLAEYVAQSVGAVNAQLVAAGEMIAKLESENEKLRSAGTSDT